MKLDVYGSPITTGDYATVLMKQRMFQRKVVVKVLKETNNALLCKLVQPKGALYRSTLTDTGLEYSCNLHKMQPEDLI